MILVAERVARGGVREVRLRRVARAAVSPSMDSGSTISDDASRSASVSDASLFSEAFGE